MEDIPSDFDGGGTAGSSPLEYLQGIVKKSLALNTIIPGTLAAQEAFGWSEEGQSRRRGESMRSCPRGE
jgi:hypothetical protein